MIISHIGVGGRGGSHLIAHLAPLPCPEARETVRKGD